VLPTSNEDGRVGENELLALKEQTHNIPLVIIKGVTGKFRGYEHPVSQLYQDKALRKGVIENHYVVEGAKRIHIKHVPAHCPGIHIPQVSLLLPSPMRARALFHSRVSPLFTSLFLSPCRLPLSLARALSRSRARALSLSQALSLSLTQRGRDSEIASIWIIISALSVSLCRSLALALFSLSPPLESGILSTHVTW